MYVYIIVLGLEIIILLTRKLCLFFNELFIEIIKRFCCLRSKSLCRQLLFDHHLTMSSNNLGSADPPNDYWIYRSPGFFDGWRHVPFPTQYKANFTPVTADVLEAGLIYATVILAFSFLLILPGFRKSERFTAFVRIVIAIFILSCIILCNFGQEWEVSKVKTKTQYRAGLRGDINASIGVNIGLRSVNITLKGLPDKVQVLEHGRVNETVDYNERFSWENEGWVLGRGGFGPYAGHFNQEFRKHQRRGSPYPILWIAEYFTLDGEGIRWGRHYLQAGYYTHIMLWTAFSLWLLSLILFNMVPRYGGYFSIATGVCMLIGNIIYSTYRNANQLVIPFDEGKLHFHWGWCFWLCLVTGILCVVIGVVVIIMDVFFSEKLADFFNVDITQDYDEIYYDPSELMAQTSAAGASRPLVAPDSPTAGTSSYNIEQVELQPPQPSATEIQRAYRKKSAFGGTTTRRMKPVPLPRQTAAVVSPSSSSAAAAAVRRPAAGKQEEEDDDGDDYENTPDAKPLSPH